MADFRGGERSIRLAGLLILCLFFGKAEADVLDPGLSRLAGEGHTRTVPGMFPLSPGKPDRVDIFLMGTPDPADLHDLGIRLRTRAGGVWTADIPLGAIASLPQVPGLTRAVLARPAKLLLDRSIPSVGADGLRTRVGDLWSGLTGKGVIVGIVDSGLDVTHDDFRKPDGSTRVKFYWDQNDLTGPPPMLGGDTLYTFGTEWSALDIDGGNRPQGDAVGHGTHVTGTAVGNGRASAVDSLRYRYAGMAPEADIVVVALDTFLETGVLDAVNYIFEKATALGQSAVVNLSLGSQFGPHDGTTPLEVGLNSLVGPGRLVVAAAGNEGEDRVHGEIQASPGGTDSASVFIPAYQTNPFFNFFIVDSFYHQTDSMTVTLVTPSGNRFGPYGLGARVEEVTGEGTLFLAHLEAFGGNRQVQFDISDYDPMTPGNVKAPANGEWKIVFKDLAGAPGGGEVDLWIAQASMVDFAGNGPIFLTGHDRGEEVSVPGSAEGVLTVGSYNTKRCWKDSTGVDQCTSVPDTLAGVEMISFFSSRGPTRDDRQKPEVVAPGFVVASSRSHQMDAEQQALYKLERTLDPDREHFVFPGTSMSAPHVTGALALLLQNIPGLTPQGARDRIRTTSREDSHTGAGWNAAAGFGKLDVGALIDTVVSASVHEILFIETGSGSLELTWTALTSDAVVHFELRKTTPGNDQVPVGQFPGPGPHSWIDPFPVSGTVFELVAWYRTGEKRTWKVATWMAPRGTPFRITAPRPNPFHGTTAIRFHLADPKGPEATEAWVVDVNGRRVQELRVGAVGADGWGLVEWHGTDLGGRTVAAGSYWIYIRAGGVKGRTRVVRLP